jgi:hypothetical protein
MLLDRRWGRFGALLLILVLPFAIAACDSQLDQETFGQIEQGQFPSNASEFRSSAAAAYAPLRNIQFSPFNIVEHTSDEVMVPTRGGDWADGGQWRRLTQHQWTATHPDLNPTWGTLQTGISRTNSLLATIDAADALTDEQKAGFSAEMRFLRAYYYYWLMDVWGGVPVVVEAGNEQYDFITQEEVSTDNRPPHNTRKEVYDFLLQELVGVNSENISVQDINNPADGSVLAGLAPKSGIEYGRATRGAGYGLLARLLLNSEVYAVPVGGPDGQGIEGVANAEGPELYEEAVAAADAVLNGMTGSGLEVGSYTLADDYFEPFSVDNAGNDEILFAATYNAKQGQGLQKQQAMLHYNQPWSAGPWNGFTTIADFYNSYDNVENNDVRQNQFMEGPQYEAPSSACAGDECYSDTSSDPVTARNSDQQINFTPEIPSLILEGDAEALEEPGARPLKFELDPNAAGSHMGNDFPLIRLAEMYLIKAEALTAANNGPTAEAEAAFDAVRTRSGADALEGSPTEDEMYRLILQERGFEFHFEMLRRQDQIRYEFAHGGAPVGFEGSDDPDAEQYAPSFTGPWRFKEPSDNFRALFPIPENQLSVNPELEQNPGY